MNAILRNILIVGAAVVAVKVTAKVLGILDDDLEPPEALAAATFLVVCGVVVICWWLFINLPPTCENRVCRARDYAIVGVAGDFGIPGHEPVVQCRCGCRYLRRGNQFLAVNERNFLEKYMVKEAWYSKWKPDY